MPAGRLTGRTRPGKHRALGAAIRAAREGSGHSQESFARLVGVDRAYYGAIERGGNVTIKTVLRVAAGLDTSLAELCKRAGI
jgi:transcriptional regulator with XRE-family HTH domain